MNKIAYNVRWVVFVVMLLLIDITAFSQVIFHDDLESYTSNAIIAPQSSRWNSWGNIDCSALVSTDEASSGIHSLKIWNGFPSGAQANLSDILLDLGDSTKGRYILSFKMFLPSSDGNNNPTGGYWNLQHIINSSYVGSEWGFQVFMNPNDSYIQIKGRNYYFQEKMDEWVTITHVFDLDRDIHDFFYGGRWVVSEDFSAQALASFAGTKVMAGLDLYAHCEALGCVPLAYYDDFTLQHFQDQYNDGGIIGFDVPPYCLNDSAEVKIELKNWGFNSIQRATIDWSINGIAQTPYVYNGNIPSNSVQKFSLGKQIFTGQAPYEIKAWVSNVNGFADTTNFNDTLSTLVTGPALNGFYTLNPMLPSSNTNFQTFYELNQILRFSGLCGPTIINVATGIYHESLPLTKVLGLSSTNTLVIDGKDSSATKLSQGSTFSTLTLSGVKHITLKNMTFENTSTTGSAILIHHSDSNTISSCVSKVRTNSTGPYASVLFSGSATAASTQANANYNTIEHCRIIGGNYGIHIYGGTSIFPTGNKIAFNQVDSAIHYGVFAYYADLIEVEGNEIEMLSKGSNTSNGIHLFFVENAKVIGNDVKSINYGIYWYNYTRYTPMKEKKLLINNMVYSKDFYPLYLAYVDSINIYHNTIYGKSLDRAAVYIEGTSSTSIQEYDIRNNIFYSEGAEAFHITSSSLITNFDYNIFYTQGSQLIRIGSTNYADIAALQAAYQNWNVNSLEGDPEFVSPLDLHLLGTLANDVGDNRVNVAFDIDLEPRPAPRALAVDVGADEYTPPSCPPPSRFELKESTYSILAKYVKPSNGLSYQFEVLKCGDSLGRGRQYFSSTDSIELNGLEPSSCYDVYVRSICDRNDTSIWRGPYSVLTQPRAPSGVNCSIASTTTIFMEEFDNPILSGWTGHLITGNVQGSWNYGNGSSNLRGTGPRMAHSGNSNVYAFVVNNYNKRLSLVSPMIDLSQVKDSAELSFWFHAYGSALGEFSVGVANSAQGPFVPIMEWSGEHGSIQESSDSSYYQVGVRLEDFIGQKIFIEFSVIPGSSYEGEFAVDLVEIKGCLTCAPPTQLRRTNKGVGSIELNWDENGNATTWELAYDTTLNYANVTNRQIVNSKPIKVDSLVSGARYQFFVRSICGSGDTSTWSGPHNFVVPYALPFLEDFELQDLNLGSSDIWKNGWEHFRSSPNNANPQWRTQAGPTTTANTGPVVDHTLGTTLGTYAYFTSEGAPGAWTNLISPEIYIEKNQNTAELSFWYHFYGSTIDRLEVLVSRNGVDQLVHTIRGQKQTAPAEPWKKQTVILTGYQGQFVKLKFRGYGSGPYGEMAIDDIELGPTANFYSIGEINTSNNLGEADSLGAFVWTSGTVAGVNLHTENGLSFTIIDQINDKQEGIHIFSDKLLSAYSNVNEGDSIKVRGIVGQINGLNKIDVDSIVLIDHGKNRPNYLEVKSLDESTESKYLELKNLILLTPLAQQSGSYILQAYSGKDTVAIKIHEKTNVGVNLKSLGSSLKVGDTLCSVVGIGSQNDTISTPPYLKGYEIIPMFFKDFKACNAITALPEYDEEQKNLISIYPNPTKGSFIIHSSGLSSDNAVISIRDRSGKLVYEELLYHNNNVFEKRIDLKNEAKGLYLISIQDGESRINKKIIIQ